jgi:hypothetical protein
MIQLLKSASPRSQKMTPLQKGFFIAETAEYAEQYFSALSAFSAMSFCSELKR